MQRHANNLRAQGKRIGLVPTMGYLHDGHLCLIEQARKATDMVVTSIYVNPGQFGPNEDFLTYPRDWPGDQKKAKKAGTDILFAPGDEDMYPPDYLTRVNVEKITRVLCGVTRPGHFQGVTTIVARLFNIVKPHVAVFGQKDAQQSIVIQRMVKDLNYDIDIIIVPTVREPDGLAMSSRLRYLSPEERRDAAVLYGSLKLAESLILDGQLNADVIKAEMRNMIDAVASSKIDYIEIVDTVNLEPVQKIKNRVLIALAVKIGLTRLIDNLVIDLETVNI